MRLTPYDMAMREYAYVLRKQGLLYREIAGRLGLSISQSRQKVRDGRIQRIAEATNLNDLYALEL